MKTIHFEDHGQDFLTWTIDEDGVVIDCQPFQLSIWRGNKVHNHKNIKTGDTVLLEDDNDPERLRPIRYPVEKVEAEEVNTRFRNFVPALLFCLLGLLTHAPATLV